MDTIEFTLKSTTPLLMHNPAGMSAPSASLGRKRIPSPEDEAEKAAYRNEDGKLVFPAIGVRNSILSGAKGMRIGKLAARPIISGAILLLDDWFPLLNEAGDPLDDYVIDTRRVVIQKAAIFRSRPRIDNWLMLCSFNYQKVRDAQGKLFYLASKEIIHDALERAGQVIGLGDYRIEKTGWFGGFSIDDMRVISE